MQPALSIKEGQVGFRKKTYLEGYIQCKVSEYLLHDKVLSSDLDMIKEKAVKCMEQYISQQEISEADKEKIKQNHKQWAEMVLLGTKQRLHVCGKIEKMKATI